MLISSNPDPAGATLETAEGEKIGQSQIAARQGITMVVLSRVGMAMPGMVLIPMVMNNLEKRGLFKRFPKAAAPLQVQQCFFLSTYRISDSLGWRGADLRDANVLCDLRAEGEHQAHSSGARAATEDQGDGQPS